MASLSILGLYNYDSTIFDGFRVPETLDRETVINALCLELAELSLVYPEAETMKQAIKIWTDLHFKEWQDLEDTLYYEYNPIWNVDGTETETRALTIKRDRRGKDTVSNSGSDTNVGQVAGFNSEDFVNSAKDTTTYGGKAETSYASGEDVGDTGTITRTRGGNIGVTKTQELIEAQREVVQFNVTDVIIKSFKRKFCVMIY